MYGFIDVSRHLARRGYFDAFVKLVDVWLFAQCMSKVDGVSAALAVAVALLTFNAVAGYRLSSSGAAWATAK